MTGMPLLLHRWLGDVARNPFDQRRADGLLKIAGILPTGVFDNEAIERFLRAAFSSHGRSKDFRELARRLYLIAVQLDSGRAVSFGTPGHDDVPISRAIEASAAVPGMYPPVGIEGKYDVDGALRHTVHTSVAFDAGAEP